MLPSWFIDFRVGACSSNSCNSYISSKEVKGERTRWEEILLFSPPSLMAEGVGFVYQYVVKCPFTLYRKEGDDRRGPSFSFVKTCDFYCQFLVIIWDLILVPCFSCYIRFYFHLMPAKFRYLFGIYLKRERFSSACRIAPWYKGKVE